MPIKLSNQDILWSYASSIVSLAGSVLLMFLVLFFLDKDMISVWYIFSSIGSMTALFDFGFSVTFARNITYSWSGTSELLPERVQKATTRQPNYKLMKKVLATCKRIYLVISGIVLLGCIVIGTPYIGWVCRESNSSTPVIAWLIYALAIFLNLYYGYYSSFLRGVGAIKSVNKNTAISKIIQIAVSVVLLSLGLGIVGACAAYVIYGVLFRILCKRDFYNYKSIGESLSREPYAPDGKEISSLFSIIWHNAWREGLISLSSYLCTQAGTLVVSAFMSLAVTGIYSLCTQIGNMVAVISGTIYVASEPSLQAAMAEADKDKIKSLMGTITFSTLTSGVVLSAFAALFAPPIIRIIKPEYVLSSALLLEICAYQVLLKFRDCYATYFSCSNRVPYVFSYLIGSVSGLLLSVAALAIYSDNLYLLVLAQLLPQAVWNIWIWPYRACREMGMSFAQVIRRGALNIINHKFI